jgi:alcohol dehydrogenase YqhD (iron-dependent ADH family)
MQNFIFENPTKIIFGKGQIPAIGKETARFGKKALLVYGMNSIKATGIYDQVAASLEKADVAFVDFPGVKSNPVLSHVNAGIELARRENADVVLAVGGGSVIDTAKAIAAGVKADHDVWDFFTFSKPVLAALPILTVVTVSASASEMNNGAVLTREDCCFKYASFSPFFQPKVSILDPTALFSLDPRYSAYSSVDILAHMLEAYFNTSEPSSPLQDRVMEGLIKTVMESTDIIMREPDHYTARANVMWGAVLGFNGFTSAGLGATPFPAHMIEHSLSALYDIAHGAGLSIVLPAWMMFALDRKKERIARLGREVFGVQDADTMKAAQSCVARLKGWFESIGTPVSLDDANIPDTDIEKIADNAVNLSKLWRMDAFYNREVIASILMNAR